MTKFRKRPVVIDAVQFDGTYENAREIVSAIPEAFFDIGTDGKFAGKLIIHTLEGDMTCSPNDWIIRGLRQEYYPCKPDVFEKSYEVVEEPEPVSP